MFTQEPHCLARGRKVPDSLWPVHTTRHRCSFCQNLVWFTDTEQCHDPSNLQALHSLTQCRMSA